MGMVINVQNTHIAKGTKTTTNGVSAYTWDTPQKVQGLEKVTITPITATGEKYGDGILRKKNLSEQVIRLELILTRYQQSLNDILMDLHIQKVLKQMMVLVVVVLLLLVLNM